MVLTVWSSACVFVAAILSDCCSWMAAFFSSMAKSRRRRALFVRSREASGRHRTILLPPLRYSKQMISMGVSNCIVRTRNSQQTLARPGPFSDEVTSLRTLHKHHRKHVHPLTATTARSFRMEVNPNSMFRPQASPYPSTFWPAAVPARAQVSMKQNRV